MDVHIHHVLAKQQLGQAFQPITIMILLALLLHTIHRSLAAALKVEQLFSIVNIAAIMVLHHVLDLAVIGLPIALIDVL